MGAGSERIDLSGADLKGDPARLADEAAAISMFGEGRWILVEQAGDEIVPALDALLRQSDGWQPGRDRGRRPETRIETAQACAR